MVTIKMKVGPKGQVVIPKVLRDEKKIFPGDEVVFDSLNEGILIEKPKRDVVADFERIAKSGKPIKVLDSDKDYDRMMRQRLGKFRLR